MKRNKANFKEIFKTSRVIRSTNLKTTLPSFSVFFKPDNYLKSLACISVNSLASLRFKWIIINTNLKNKDDKRIVALKTWIDSAKKCGLKILILTNRPKRLVEKNLNKLKIKCDAYISFAGKPFVLKRKKLLSIVEDLNSVFMICNDFLVDTPTANILKIQSTMIEDNLIHTRWIDRKVADYQKRLVIYFLKKSNMLNELESFEVNSSTLNDFI